MCCGPEVYDAVGNSDGDVFMIGYTQSSVVNWGGTLQTKIIEEGDDQNDDAVSACDTLNFFRTIVLCHSH